MAEENTMDTPQNTEEQAPVEAEVDASAAVESPEMEELKSDGPAASNGGGESMNLDFLLDIPLSISVEVGRTKMLISDLLQLQQGSVIELNKLVGEPFEIMVNDKHIARGEVVVVNERFGIRITDIMSPSERVQTLQ